MELAYQGTDDSEITDRQNVVLMKKALMSASTGDSDLYEQLVGTMHIAESKRKSTDGVADGVGLLVTSLKALSGAAHYIDAEQHGRLLSSIIGMSMWEHDPIVMDVLVEFIVSLAGSSGRYVDLCLEMLVSNFIPNENYPLERLCDSRGVAKKKQVLGRVHGALKDIADLVPLAPSRLFRIIIDRMPNMFTKESVIAVYVESMFRLELSAIGELVGGGTLIVAVVDRLIELDAEIGWDYILAEDSTKGIFEMELEDQQTAVDFPRESLTRKGSWGEMMADKLDTLMVLTFEHVKTCENSGRWVEVFESILHSFEKTVLPTYKCKFTQFVMFYACSLDPDGCGARFAYWLGDKFFFSNDLLTRMSSVGYLASYLARARFLSTSLVTCMLERLVHWCSEYCKISIGNMDPNDQTWLYGRCQHHKLFYAGCQAVLYVLCFRMRSIMDTPRLKSQLLLLPFQQILKNSFEPLQVCLPSIVQEFVHQGSAAQLLDESASIVLDGMLESEFSKAFGGLERLDMFFPFDPCLLKKCDSYIRPNYVYWSMVRMTYEIDEDEDDISSDDDDDNDAGQKVAPGEEFLEGGKPQNFDYLEDFNDSLGNMSITPKNSLHWKVGGEMSKFPMQMPSRIRPSSSPESL
ncbi:hypothetical protein Dimus_026466 [Dionaea muscipula]